MLHTRSFIYTLLLAQEQADEAWERSKKQRSFGSPVVFDSKELLTWFVIFRVLISHVSTKVDDVTYLKAGVCMDTAAR
jgi:hypothetical protein